MIPSRNFPDIPLLIPLGNFSEVLATKKVVTESTCSVFSYQEVSLKGDY